MLALPLGGNYEVDFKVRVPALRSLAPPSRFCMRISELSKRTHLKAHTIRFYEKQGLFAPRSVRRKENNYRDYGEDAVEQLLLIREGQLAGFTVAEMKELAHGDAAAASAEDQAMLIRRKIAAISSKIIRLQRFQTYLLNKLKSLQRTDIA